jgi:ribosomal protein S18 acetylase RimI-like enzyme
LFNVVDVRLEHAQGFREAVDAVAREGRYLARLEAPPMDQMIDFVRTNIECGNPHVVALNKDAVVGWADIRPAGPPLMKHCGTLGMGVVASYRGQGLGGRLLEAVLARSWAFGLQRVELEVRSDNALAIALYERLGFLIEGRKVRAMCVDGEYFDMLQMARLRDPASSRPNISLQADREG